MNLKARSDSINLIPSCFQTKGRNIIGHCLKIFLLIYILVDFLLNLEVHITLPIIFTIKLFYRGTFRKHFKNYFSLNDIINETEDIQSLIRAQLLDYYEY